MDAAIGGDFQHGIAVLVHDEDVAVIVFHGEVRAGERGVGGVAALVAGFPEVRDIGAGVAVSGVAVAGDGVQDAVGLDQIGERLRRVRGDIHRVEPEEGVVGREGKAPRAGGVGGVIILQRGPGGLAVGAVQRGGGFNGANAARVGVGPGDLAGGTDCRELQVRSRRREQRAEGQEPEQVSDVFWQKHGRVSSEFWRGRGSLIPGYFADTATG